MLVASVADKLERFDFGGILERFYICRDESVSSTLSSTSEHQRLLMNQDYNQPHSTQHLVQPSTGTARPTNASVQDNVSANMFRPPMSTTEMTYLGQTLVPQGYPDQTLPSSAPVYDQVFRGQQLEAWQVQIQQHQQQIASSGHAQRHYFSDVQSLQAGSRTSLSSGRASFDVPAHNNQQQHAQAVLLSQQPQSQHHSPHGDYMMTTIPHHHHSMPSHARATMSNSDHGENSSRERDGGAPNVVGHEGMPEPAARPRGPKLKFTRADDALLVELKESKNLTWKQIADFFPGRSSGTLQVRYCTKLKAKTTIWTDDMVQRLRNAMAEYENERWRVVSNKVGNGFSATACQDKALELEMEDAGETYYMGELEEEDEYQD